MAQLKDPQKQIPGGYTFFEPSTKWSPAPFSSLDSIVTQLVQHRLGRPDLIAKNHWAVDPQTVLEEVKAYNVAVCERNGWTDYIMGSAETVPFQPPTRPSLLARARNVAAGADTLVEWIQEGQPVVDQATAETRSAICAACSKNGKGGLEAYFTVPVSNAIRRELERKQGMNLRTTHDEVLGVCTACSCPLPLKMWIPLSNILAKLPAESMKALDPSCWILPQEK